MSRITPTRLALAAALTWATAASAQTLEPYGFAGPEWSAPVAASGLTRAQVLAELDAARRAGAIDEGGEIGASEHVLAARAAYNESATRVALRPTESAPSSESIAATRAEPRAADTAGRGLRMGTAEVPDSRIIAIDGPTLFEGDTLALSPVGVERLRNYAHVMQHTRVEVIVISIPLAPELAPVAANQDAEARAHAIKAVLAREGIAEDRIYTEVRPLSSMVVGTAEPVVIETVAAFS